MPEAAMPAGPVTPAARESRGGISGTTAPEHGLVTTIRAEVVRRGARSPRQLDAPPTRAATPVLRPVHPGVTLRPQPVQHVPQGGGAGGMIQTLLAAV